MRSISLQGILQDLLQNFWRIWNKCFFSTIYRVQPETNLNHLQYYTVLLISESLNDSYCQNIKQLQS